LVLYDEAVVKLLERQLANFNVDWIQVIEQLGYRGSKQSNLVSLMQFNSYSLF
jgi:hypothetical protein